MFSYLGSQIKDYRKCLKMEDGLTIPRSQLYVSCTQKAHTKQLLIVLLSLSPFLSICYNCILLKLYCVTIVLCYTCIVLQLYCVIIVLCYNCIVLQLYCFTLLLCYNCIVSKFKRHFSLNPIWTGVF